MKPKIYLHVGLPKTGTTTFQFGCAERRTSLERNGLLYPDTGVRRVPKHQFLVLALREGVLAPLSEASTAWKGFSTLLSTEGLTNHLYDFSAQALAEFRRILADFEVEVILVVRERSAWLRSYYKQNIINGPNPKFLHGTTQTLAEFGQEERVLRLTRHDKLAQDAAVAYGAGKIQVLSFEDDWMGRIARITGVPDLAFRDSEPKNQSLADWKVEIIRQFNGFGLQAQARRAWLQLIKACPDDDAGRLGVLTVDDGALDLGLLDRLNLPGQPGMWLGTADIERLRRFIAGAGCRSEG